MTFTNAFNASPDEVRQYVRDLLGMLGGREPFAILREQVGWLETRTRGLDEATLRRPEAPGKWSVIEVVQHLADVDMIVGYRIRIILEKDNPPIQGYDQDVWAERLRYRDVRLPDALDQLRAMRAANLRLYRSLGPAELARSGVHSERGPESVQRLIDLQAGHDLVHRRQIDRILKAAG